MLVRTVLAKVVDKMERSYVTYDDLSLKAPVIMQEAVSAMEYGCGTGLDDSLAYEIVECAARCDFRLSSSRWKDVKNLLAVIVADGGFENVKFDSIEHVLSESPTWAVKRAIIKVALETAKGTK